MISCEPICRTTSASLVNINGIPMFSVFDLIRWNAWHILWFTFIAFNIRYSDRKAKIKMYSLLIFVFFFACCPSLAHYRNVRRYQILCTGSCLRKCAHCRIHAFYSLWRERERAAFHMLGSWTEKKWTNVNKKRALTYCFCAFSTYSSGALTHSHTSLNAHLSRNFQINFGMSILLMVLTSRYFNQSTLRRTKSEIRCWICAEVCDRYEIQHRMSYTIESLHKFYRRICLHGWEMNLCIRIYSARIVA